MFRRCTLIFCVFFVVLAQGNSQELDADDRSFLSHSLLKAGKELLEKELGGGPTNCIEQAVDKCKHEIKHLKKFLDCSKDYFKENKGICLLN